MKNLKRFKLSTVFLLVTMPVSMAFANNANHPCNFCGFSLGLGVGATTFMTDLHDNSSLVSDYAAFELEEPLLQPDDPESGISNQTDTHIYRFGGMARFFAGYGMTFGGISYLGTELGVNFFKTRKISLSQTTTSSDFSGFDDIITTQTVKTLNTQTYVSRNKSEPFLDVKLGLLTTPNTLFYLRGGINYNKIKVKQFNTYQASGETIGGDPFISGETSFAVYNEKSKRAIGYRTGFGVEWLLTPALGLSTDYVYSFYPHVRSTVNNTVTDLFCNAFEGCPEIPATHTSHVSAKADDQEILAQLIYHFDQ